MKRAVFFLIMIVVLVEMGAALDIRDGLVRITTDDLTLRPMLYRLVNIAGKSKYEPLWFNGDPRTSFITISVDNRIYRMGYSQEYQTSQRRIQNGIEIEYRSVTNRVTQRIMFAALAGSRVANGFIIELEVENYTSRDMKIMLKEVCDTWLGENTGNHIALASKPKVTDEMLLNSDSKEPYIISPGQDASIALLFDSDPRPDSVVIANWKRLSDSKFFYDSELMRGFTLSPYSVNDSALGLYWNDKIVPAKGVVKVESRWLSGGPGSEFISWLTQNYPPKEAEETQAISQKNASPGISSGFSLDVEAIQALVSRIDSAIENIDNVTDEDLQLILSELEALENSDVSGTPD
ncbi:MAG: hypothetical protein ABFC92_04040 [Rectinema sp.]